MLNGRAAALRTGRLWAWAVSPLAPAAYGNTIRVAPFFSLADESQPLPLAVFARAVGLLSRTDQEATAGPMLWEAEGLLRARP